MTSADRAFLAILIVSLLIPLTIAALMPKGN
jgi:hypothetical protein